MFSHFQRSKHKDLLTLLSISCGRTKLNSLRLLQIKDKLTLSRIVNYMFSDGSFLIVWAAFFSLSLSCSRKLQALLYELVDSITFDIQLELVKLAVSIIM